MKILLRFLCVVLLSLGIAQTASGASTDGTVTFTYQLVDYSGGYSPKHIDVIWVAGPLPSTNFVKTIRKDANNRQNYLAKWNAAKNGWTAVDGSSGATISSFNVTTVTWNCRDTNNVVMPDGDYKIFVEYTHSNGQGPWTTNGLTFTKGPSNFSSSYAGQQYMTGLQIAYVPAAPPHDIAVAGISPASGLTNLAVNLQVIVTNKTSSAEASIAVTVSNATTGTLIGSQTIASLAASTATPLSFPWPTAGLVAGKYSLVAKAGPVAGETIFTDNSFTNVFDLRILTHDIAVRGIDAPAQVDVTGTNTIIVAVTNDGHFAESFNVVLTDVTAGAGIATNQISNLAAASLTNVSFQWTLSNSGVGYHTLRAVAEAVAGEIDTTDNASTAVVYVTPPQVTNMALIRSNMWRFNDTGTDLGTAWRQPGYNDSAWQKKQAPLGYGENNLTTTISYGSSSTSKYPTYYFRTTFYLDSMPSSFIMNLRRDDGAVVYLNGVEIYRIYMNDPVTYASLANYTVGNNDEFTYFQTNLPAANAVLGTNSIAVEIHQCTADSSDVSFDLELLTVGTKLPDIHDVAATQITAPPQGVVFETNIVWVTVTNAGGFVEPSLVVALFDDTDGALLGVSTLNNFMKTATANISFSWMPTNLAQPNHALRAVALPVDGETILSNNTNMLQVSVGTGVNTNTFIAKGSVWKFNDLGIDLGGTPWNQNGYYDGTWKSRAAPLGYCTGTPPALTNMNYVVSYGTDTNNKYPTYYFRRSFNVDMLPCPKITLNVRRDDGAIFYLNGVEVARMNMPDGPIHYTNYAVNAVNNADQYTYYSTNFVPNNLVVGPNVLAVELHQASGNSTDIVLDVEMLGLIPRFTVTHGVSTLSLNTPGGVLRGDKLPISVTITNQGNVTENALVVIKDIATGQTVGTQTLSNVVAGGSATAQFSWATLSATNGTHTLQAYTVVGGVTNLAGSVTGQAELTGTGIGLNPATVLGSLGGRCSAVAAYGNLLVFASGATLEVWDRTNPFVPVKTGSVRLPGQVEDVAVNGSFAYAACGAAGVQFVDISVPSAPMHVNTYDTSGHAYSLAVAGNYLYVADGSAGLRIVNITAPASPTLAGAYYTAGPARAVSLFGTVAYVLDEHAGLLLINVGNPSSPSLLGAYNGCGMGVALLASSSYAYVVDANNQFYVVNVATPSAPTLLNTNKTFLLTNLVARSITRNANTVYVPVGDAGVAVINVATPSAPIFQRVIPTPGEATDAALSGAALYLADGFHGMQVYDASAAATPVLQTDLPTSIRGSDVAVSGDLAYVAAGESGLRIYNVSTPAAPVWIGWFAGAVNARCIAVSGSTAYVGDGQYGLKVVNVAAPDAPALLGSWSDTNLTSIRNIGVSGSLVAASDGSRVCLFDVSNPSTPLLRDTYTAPGFAFDMTVSGGNVYLACGNAGLVILDISSSMIAQRSVTSTAGLATGVAISGTTAFIANGASGWLKYDVTSAASPTLLDGSAAQGPVTSVAVSGVLATMGNGANAAITMDISKPLSPVPAQSFAGLANALRITAAGGQAYLSEDDAGLAILSAGGTPLVLQIAPSAGGTGGLALKWLSKPGKTYAIYKSTNLALGSAGFTLVQGNIAANPPMNSVSVATDGTAAFYVINEQ